ncbi:MAG TPA: hypothetical protein DCQ31_13935, partial [Bacteroidales bacterium]|nr:hypothetical protein [Bacteroidales bacterium]
SEIGTWEFEISTKEWYPRSSKVIPDSDFELMHTSGNAYLFAISQADSIDKSMLEFAAIEKFNNALANAKLLRRTDETIKNANFMRIAFTGFEGDKEVVYDGVFYTGKQGTLQIFIRAEKQFYDQNTEFITQTFQQIYLKQ